MLTDIESQSQIQRNAHQSGNPVKRAHLLIGGAEKAARDGKSFERIGPISNAVITIAAAASPDDAREAVDASAAALAQWSATGPAGRRLALQRAADALDAQREAIVASMMAETGAARSWAQFNIKLGCELLREAAAMTTQLTGDVIPSDTAGSLSIATRQPWGVCLGIAPWNAPIILFVRAFAMPLACGNTVVVKASEMCPGTHFLIAKAMQSALPPGVLNLVSHAQEDAAAVVQALISHDAVRHINFTGSSHVGRIIGRQAGELLKPVLLELGGKSPTIVLEDADLDEAVDATAFGAFMHQGQICMATGRVVVVESIADEFVARLAKKTATLKAGDPSSGAPLGAMIGERAAQRIDRLIADAVARGAVVKAGGPGEGVYRDACLLDHVTPDMEIYHAEAFGPVLPVVRVADDSEAVRVANDTEYGLSAAIFSRDIKRAFSVSRQIESGICHINGPTIQDEAQIPFGGIKASGHGRFGGKGGVEAFTYLRWTTVDTEKPHYPF